jgi:hypothetical protein
MPFLLFLNNNRSVALLLLSTIITAGVAVPTTIMSGIIHGLNFAILFGLRKCAMSHPEEFTMPGILLMISIGGTALISNPTPMRLVFEAINLAVLLVMWHMAMTEKKA